MLRDTALALDAGVITLEEVKEWSTLRIERIAACPEHKAVSGESRAYVGPASNPFPEPQAWGGTEWTDICACGAVRRMNCRHAYREQDRWWS